MADDIQLQSSGQAQGAAQTGAQTTAQPATQTTQVATPAPAKQKAGVINLEEEAMQADQMQPGAQAQYSLPSSVQEKFPDLVQLIKETESMNDEERDYWFQILPIMTEDQISKFREILLNEKQQLQQLDNEYEGELTKLNEKHMLEWKEFESKEKRKAIAGAEAKNEEEERAQEEDLLQRLAQV